MLLTAGQAFCIGSARGRPSRVRHHVTVDVATTSDQLEMGDVSVGHLLGGL